jgi:hypothetical protein
MISLAQRDLYKHLICIWVTSISDALQIIFYISNVAVVVTIVHCKYGRRNKKNSTDATFQLFTIKSPGRCYNSEITFQNLSNVEFGVEDNRKEEHWLQALDTGRK